MSVSANALAASFAPETDEVWVALLLIEHAAITPIRVCDNMEDVVSNGQTYVAYPFDIRLPGSNAREMPKVTLTIDNVDRTIVETLRAVATPATVTLSIVLASSPDTIEAGPYRMTLRSARTPNPAQVQGELAYEDVLNQPFPAASFTPNLFPGLFS